MNHQSRNKYYSDERGPESERRTRERFREENPSWDYEDEDEDFQSERPGWYRSAGQRNRGNSRRTRSPGARNYGRDYESAYGDFEESYRQPAYSPSGQAYSDWRDNPQRGGGSGQSRYGSPASGYGSTSSGYGADSSNYGQRGSAQRGSQQYGGSPAGANYWYSEYWLIPGPYSGTGPKGYQRSPESLKEQVCERLEAHGEIDASEIEVAIQDGEVTLSGKAESREQKRMAEDCACSVRGVKDVHNQLKVEGKKPSKPGDNQMGESKSADKKNKPSSNPAF